MNDFDDDLFFPKILLYLLQALTYAQRNDLLSVT